MEIGGAVFLAAGIVDTEKVGGAPRLGDGVVLACWCEGESVDFVVLQVCQLSWRPRGMIGTRQFLWECHEVALDRFGIIPHHHDVRLGLRR